MRRIAPLVLSAALLAAALPAAAQDPPRRPPADTLRFGATRPAAGDSIRMAEPDEEERTERPRGNVTADPPEEASDIIERERPKPGPYSRSGGSGPFTVQASGQAAARERRASDDVVWLQGRAARPAADSARRDTARASGQRVAAAPTAARRDTASAATRPRRDTAAAATRPVRRDSAATARPAARDTASARRNGSASTPPSSSSTRQGQSATTTPNRTNTAAGGRTGSGVSGTTGTQGSGSASSGSSSSRARTHTVASGETFFGIARRYGVTAAQLRAINPDVEMDALEIGDVLRLPAGARDSRAGSGSGSGATGSQRTSSSSSSSSSAARRTHTVAAGETLFAIARRYGVTVAAIREANEMESDQVRTGQRLVIPPAR